MQLGLDFSARPHGLDLPHSETRNRQLPPEVYSEDEIRPLLGACRNNDIGVRHRALIVLLWRSGLRISEALALLPNDLNREDRSLFVRRGKGGHPRLVAADHSIFGELDPWIERRRLRGLDERCPIFCTLKGHPLDDSYVRHAFRRLARAAGFHRRIHPHAFRHTHAAELWAEGIPEKLIQAQLGHRSLDTTDKYLRTVATPERLIAAIATRQPSPTR